MSVNEQHDTTAATADGCLQVIEGKTEDVTKQLLSDQNGVSAQVNENSGGTDSIPIKEVYNPLKD